MKQFSAILLAAIFLGCSTPENGSSLKRSYQQFQTIEKGMTRREVYATVGSPTTKNPSVTRGLPRAYPGLQESGATVEQWLVTQGKNFAELIVAFSPEGEVLAANIARRWPSNE